MSTEHDLTARHCTPCEGGAAPMTRKEAQATLRQIAGWELSEDGTMISRRFRFKNFFETMAFINAMAWIANTQDHHPDFSASYNYCLVNYTTHAIGGLSENDFICAAKVTALLDE
ncbi:MAG: 4a-hydroxytetrahydrobiopterin dehydratase [Proteobacteria bacterium]|nr:4a-hydroxytetrahydrobiopterin dehydratase [Pseudomonadota bacterium]